MKAPGRQKKSAVADGGLKEVLGQPSWRLASPRVEAYVTQTGGQVAPVTFDRRGAKIRPMSVAPWATEALDPSEPPIIRALRGDFFCMPFGGNSTPYRNERHPPHGETANSKWKLQRIANRRGERPSLHLSLQPRVRPGRVDKYIQLGFDHDAVYQRHVVSGMTGPLNFGHHAMLRFPDEPAAGIVATSPFVYGQVFPEPMELPENRGYSILKPGAEFKTLDKVPMLTGEMADLSRYPARRGFEDLVMLVADDRAAFAWTAVTFPKQRYVWFALKDPRVLRSTIFWISNGGRHYAPWSGRHVNVMGLEEVTSYFHQGLVESVARNPVSRRGYATHTQLAPDQPLVVNYIFGIAAVPAGFGRVETIEQSRSGVTLRSGGTNVHVPVDVPFLQDGSGAAP
jgi:hypothetical protein